MKLHKERRHATLSVGESVRMIRELQGLTQAELADATGISQSAISGIERERVALGADRARTIARALRVHPAVLLFPDWTADELRVPRAS